MYWIYAADGTYETDEYERDEFGIRFVPRWPYLDVLAEEVFVPWGKVESIHKQVLSVAM